MHFATGNPRSVPLAILFLLLFSGALVLGCTPEPVAMDTEAPDPAILVVLTAEDNMSQGMSMVLANQSLDQGAQVRVLLCGPAGRLGLQGHDGDVLQPREVSPGQLLNRLIENGVLVEVCAIFLPNTEWTEDDLREGVGVAQPADVASWMLGPGVRLFTF
jgi:predicted peroxiredoxin